jgi:hypothetical protein
MRYAPDEFSRHEYEIKNVFTEGDSFPAVVFYLRYNDSVEIDIEGVLKKTGLWSDPDESEPQRTYHMLFEIAPRNGNAGTVDLYVSRFVAEYRKNT